MNRIPGDPQSHPESGEDAELLPSGDEPQSSPALDDEVPPPAAKLQERSSRTVAYDGPHLTNLQGGAGEDATSAGSGAIDLEAVAEDSMTVISQRPVASPAEFYRSMPLAELAAMLEGRQLDHFAVDQMIGGGGMGAVFRGRDLRLDRVVAIKVIPASKRDPETLRRFRLEAQAAARLDHPNIARVFYVGEAEQWNYIVFEFIDGVNIRDLVELEGPLGVDDAVYYTRQVAEALQHAHQRDVVHRDIKPSNVLVTANGHIKVVDMGLARDTSLDKSTADATASGVTLGTFDYISPEQARNPRDADVRSDLYSLGCTLFFLLTGHPPFPEGTALQKLLNHGSQPPPDPRAWREDLSDQLYEITMKLMAKRPADRYQKPVDLINDLVLLAEIEELPRSQTPGTFLVSPSIAQRTLLEANLPWMVALAFLLGSTLWLQSVQSLSNDFLPDFEGGVESGIASSRSEETPHDHSESPQAMPNLPAPSPASGSSASATPEKRSVVDAAATSATGPDAASSGAEGQTASRGAAVDVLVVASEQPFDVAPMRWESSFATAVERYAQDPSLKEIEIRGRVVVDRPVYLGAGVLKLRGNLVHPAILELPQKSAATNGDAWMAWLNLRDTQLTCTDVAFRMDVPAAGAISKQAVFDMKASSTLELQHCSVTVKKDVRRQNTFVVLSGGSTKPLLTNESVEVLKSGLGVSETNRLTIVAKNCVVRGEAAFIGFQNLDLANRLEVSIDNSLVVLSGPTIEVKGPSAVDSQMRFVRLMCTHSTFVNERGFASLDYVGEGAPLLGLNRTSEECAYWSREGEPQFVIRGLTQPSLNGNFNMLLLRGHENAYDANIRDICHVYSGQTRIAQFGFIEAQVNGYEWFDELGNEAQVMWQKAGVPEQPLYEANVEDMAVTKGLFQPGVALVNPPPL
ncbi:serine/threonine protein kinase [Aureliella helgolandensis]|uniref:non-specific serine/threonine protein kinase n=1 Tax=Aureliella helgolandensis TaxID=2527968 RepID=A0A518GH29_9BACT|nr:serine/threonine-protein kinase [Aureliella helgolandensis]QDV27893.1 Serine/threonine-protein kinase PknB [Aureliella helgolandensis]